MSTTEYHQKNGRLFAVLAKYEANVEGAAEANRFFSNNPKAHVLEVEDGWIIITDKRDMGIAT